jgi:hypothetical protein
MIFSNKYSTFNEWIIDRPTNTGYTNRIVRLHNLHPEASLSQLRGHAVTKEKSLSAKQGLVSSKRSWQALNPKEKLTREKSLEVLSEVRRNKKSLTQASREKGISIKTVMQHTNAFKKIGNRWMPKTYDRISRVMKINTAGKVKSIEINDSRTASLIGRYHNAVKKYIDTGDTRELARFEGKAVKDVNGNLYTFETDTEALDDIHEGIEEPEFYDVYSV